MTRRARSRRMAPERRVAWVTGGGRGIGRASALALARAGHDVGLSARSTAELAEAAAQCLALGVRAAVAECDVTDRAAVEAAHARVTKELGAPTVLVNAAGMARSMPFLKTAPDFWEMLWRVNVMGLVHATQVALPAMLADGFGRVVNVASVAGKAGAPYIAAYAATKHAVLGVTRSLAQEYAAKGVTVNAVCPGYVDTKMTDDNVENMVRVTGRPREEILASIRRQSPQDRMMTPDEVADVVAFLARAESAGVNGQAITIDGGGVQW